jgi:hypothetical protein
MQQPTPRLFPVPNHAPVPHFQAPANTPIPDLTHAIDPRIQGPVSHLSSHPPKVSASTDSQVRIAKQSKHPSPVVQAWLMSEGLDCNTLIKLQRQFCPHSASHAVQQSHTSEFRSGTDNDAGGHLSSWPCNPCTGDTHTVSDEHFQATEGISKKRKQGKEDKRKERKQGQVTNNGKGVGTQTTDVEASGKAANVTPPVARFAAAVAACTSPRSVQAHAAAPAVAPAASAAALHGTGSAAFLEDVVGGQVSGKATGAPVSTRGKLSLESAPSSAVAAPAVAATAVFAAIQAAATNRELEVCPPKPTFVTLAGSRFGSYVYFTVSHGPQFVSRTTSTCKGEPVMASFKCLGARQYAFFVASQSLVLMQLMHTLMQGRLGPSRDSS